jgi:cytochrome P450
MAMMTHPAVMKKAQAELDSVIGSERLPTFADIEDLPYLRALCQEVSRWRPVSSGGFRHALTEDVQYKNYILPKGSAIAGNHW